jgi:choline-sulfatase
MSRSILIAPVALMAGPIAALIASAPAAARVADERIAFLAAWPAIAGLVGVPIAALIAALRLARRSLGDRTASSASALLWGAAVWLCLSLPAHAALAALLKATTHHRALGGATFAMFALILNGLAVLAAWRFTVSGLPRLSPRARSKDFALVVALAAGMVVLSAVIVGAVGAGGPPDAALADRVYALLVDGTLAVAATALAALWDVSPQRANIASWGGASGLALLGSVALSSLVQSPNLSKRVVEQAPFAAAIGQTVGLSTDVAPAAPRPPSVTNPRPR